MNVVDSSGWLEYFADGPNAAESGFFKFFPPTDAPFIGGFSRNPVLRRSWRFGAVLSEVANKSMAGVCAIEEQHGSGRNGWQEVFSFLPLRSVDAGHAPGWMVRFMSDPNLK